VQVAVSTAQLSPPCPQLYARAHSSRSRCFRHTAATARPARPLTAAQTPGGSGTSTGSLPAEAGAPMAAAGAVAYKGCTLTSSGAFANGRAPPEPSCPNDAEVSVHTAAAAITARNCDEGHMATLRFQTSQRSTADGDPLAALLLAMPLPCRVRQDNTATTPLEPLRRMPCAPSTPLWGDTKQRLTWGDSARQHKKNANNIRISTAIRVALRTLRPAHVSVKLE
jgi:hypothetical protein